MRLGLHGPSQQNSNYESPVLLGITPDIGARRIRVPCPPLLSGSLRPQRARLRWVSCLATVAKALIWWSASSASRQSRDLNMVFKNCRGRGASQQALATLGGSSAEPIPHRASTNLVPLGRIQQTPQGMRCGRTGGWAKRSLPSSRHCHGVNDTYGQRGTNVPQLAGACCT